MRVGSLVKAHKDCSGLCNCIFCQEKSNRIGLIVETWKDENDEFSHIAEFDFGLWTIWSHLIDQFCIEEL